MSKDETPMAQPAQVQQQLKVFSPPFSRENSLRFLDGSEVRTGDCTAQFPADITAAISPRPLHIRPKRETSDFLRWELETPRLDRIYKRLWLAGECTPARPLHRQKVMRRSIVVTENPDEHLLTESSVIFIKPLSEYLLSFDFWEEHLCSDEELYRAACGLLLSYTWLVAFKSDMRIAREEHLIPQDLPWISWTSFVDNFLDNVECSQGLHVGKRFHYGELQLRRLNYIFKLSPSLVSSRNLMRGYMPASMWYRPLIERNLTRLLALFVFFSVILSALQVGLSTDKLRKNTSFQSASYGFAVASTVFALFGAWAITGTWTCFFIYHMIIRRNSRVKPGNLPPDP